jgi:protein-S-isoprenylcysteine O-methyltransferase Ste14
MNEILRIVLPVYFIIYFGVAMILKSLIVAKQIGKSPMVLPKDDSAYGLVGLYFKLMFVVLFIYTIVFAFFPTLHCCFLPVIWLNTFSVSLVGLILMMLSLVWTVIAQNDMRNSWRIGIDTDTKTELITTGLFKISRNPIFFGMILTLIGLFLATPNAFTALFFILGYVLIQIQIRLEEEFLSTQHGESYQKYKQRVRRFI